jgi:hypothetical protein
MAKKEPDFVVSDRRKFTEEGELRPDVKEVHEEPAATTPAPQPPGTPSESAPAPEAAQEQPGKFPPPPSAAEQQAQHDAFNQSSRSIDQQIDASKSGRSSKEFEMSFERFIASMYMTALMQLGMVRDENAPPVADLIGARQTIDTLSILQEKTKGNLSDAESNLLQNVLYELRMAFVEITNAIARGPGPGTPNAPAGPFIK